ncbi:MAG: ABC transporter ATP-binding protein [Planctomycetes bacterium]|nr:ABC transporter ATP-binding protein [Planctomycetota bacterium]
MPPGSSRSRYAAYRAAQRERRRRAERTIVSFHGTERSLKRQRSFGQLFRSFLGELRPFRGSMGIALGTLTIGTILNLVPPAATKVAIDNVFMRQPLPASLARWLPTQATTDASVLLTWIAGTIVTLSFLGTVVHLTGRWQATRVTKLLQASLRRAAFQHAVHLPLGRIWQLKSGGLTSLLREDAGGVAELVFSMIYNPCRAIVQLVGILTVLAWTDWRLLLGAVLLLPLVWFSHRTWIGRIRPLYRDIRQQRSEVDAHSTETFGGMRVVRAFARERSESGRFATGSHLMARQEILTWWWSRGIELAWALFVPIGSALLLWYGGKQVLGGSLTPGDLVLFMTYLVMLLGPMEALASSTTNFQTNLAGYDRTLDLLSESPELPDRAGARTLNRETVRGDIAVEGLTFAYPGANEHVLTDVSFQARSGEMIAFVGASGAGKTTLSNLIARFFDPISGCITIDGTDLRDIQLSSWRRLLGVVEQDVFLFDGTVAENIAYADREASRTRIEAAARTACAHDFIVALPQGYDTLVGERGVRLSGGQRQRLAIARAVLADPRVLILDEATSNLDVESEQAIQQGLANLMRQRTSFVIAHRLSTIRHADRIVVLRGGRVVQQGSHDELMQGSGPYRDMVLIQTARPDLRTETRAQAAG